MNHLQFNGLVILGRGTDCYQISHIPAIEETSCVSVSVEVRGKVEGIRDVGALYVWFSVDVLEKVEGIRDVGAVVSTRISCVFVWPVDIKTLDSEVSGLSGNDRFVPHTQCRVIFAKKYKTS